MTTLQFPGDRIVGVLDWPGVSYQDGPILATGKVTVPDDALLSLEVADVLGTEQFEPGSWSVVHGPGSIDLGFLRALPSTGIHSLTLRQAAVSTVTAIGHLAAGLRRLYLAWTGFSDAVLPAVAALTELTYLQTFGNAFTDAGVQQLASLVKLESLYLEEETLTVAAFGFAAQLPRLRRLGVQDVLITPSELVWLRAELPGIEVG